MILSPMVPPLGVLSSVALESPKSAKRLATLGPFAANVLGSV